VCSHCFTTAVPTEHAIDVHCALRNVMLGFALNQLLCAELCAVNRVSVNASAVLYMTCLRCFDAISLVSHPLADPGMGELGGCPPWTKHRVLLLFKY